MTFKFTLLCLMIYSIVMCAFMMSNVLTGFSIPWLDKITEKLARAGVVITLAIVIVAFGIFAYGIATMDPSFVEVLNERLQVRYLWEVF